MALQLIDVTPGAGDTAPAGGAKINSNFTELFNIHVVNPRMFRVEMDGDDDTGAVGSSKPFATLAAAMVGAEELSETVEGAEVFIGAGEYQETENITTASEYLSIIGSSILNTRVGFTSSSKLTIAAPNFFAGNLSLLRDGANAGEVLTCNVTSLSTWLENIHMDGVFISNPNGKAVGTWTGQMSNSHCYGKTAMDWAYGSQCTNTTFECWSSDDTESVYGVYQAQSCYHLGWPEPALGDLTNRYSPKQVLFKNCIFIGTGPRAGLFNGLVEDEAGAGTTFGPSRRDYHGDRANDGDYSTYTIDGATVASQTVLQTTTPHLAATGEILRFTSSSGITPSINGAYTVEVIDATHLRIPLQVTASSSPSASFTRLNYSLDWHLANQTQESRNWITWWTPHIVSCDFYGPQVWQREHGASGYCLRGCLRIVGSLIFGAYGRSWVHDGESTGTYWVGTGVERPYAYKESAFNEQGSNYVIGGGNGLFEELGECVKSGGAIQNDGVRQIGGLVPQFDNYACNMIGGDANWPGGPTGEIYGVIGSQQRAQQALRCGRTTQSCARSVGMPMPANLTAECWFRTFAQYPDVLAGATTDGSATIELTVTDLIPGTQDLVPGTLVFGNGIPAGAYVASVTDRNTFVLSAAATSTTGPGITTELTFKQASFGVIAWNDAAVSTSWVILASPTGNSDSGQLRAIVGGVDSGWVNAAFVDSPNPLYHHIALTVAGTTAKLWFDGSQIWTGTVTALSGSFRFYVGAYSDGANPTTGGKADYTEVRLSTSIRYASSFPITPAAGSVPRFKDDSDTFALYSGRNFDKNGWPDQSGVYDLSYFILNHVNAAFPVRLGVKQP